MDYHGNILSFNGKELKFIDINLAKKENSIFIDENNNLVYGDDVVFIKEENNTICLMNDNLSEYKIDFYGEKIKISSFGCFLSSNKEGNIFFSHLDELWETFLPIKKEFFDVIYYIKNFCFNNDLTFMIENFIIQYDSRKFSIIKNNSISLDQEKLIFLDENFSLFEIKKINPAIYFCAFSSEEIIMSAIVSIKSFIDHSNVKFQYFLFTNMKNFDFPTDIPSLKIIFIPSFGMISHLYKRYSFEILNNLRNYSPIFYSDCDIICNNDIRDIVSIVFESNIIYVNSEKNTEKDIIINSGWFIGNYNKIDTEIIEENIKPVNSGFFGYKNTNVFRTVSKCMDTISKTINTVNHGNYYSYDQSSFNYVLIKFCDFNIDFFQKFIINWPDDNFSNIDRCGIVHFCGGLGEFSSKYEKMVAYSEYINR